MTNDARAPSGPIVFRCLVCNAYVCLGYDCDPLARPEPRLGRWYCEKHRPAASTEPAVTPGPAPKSDKQGNLL